MQGHFNSVVLLTRPGTLHPAVRDLLHAHRSEIGFVRILGDRAVLADLMQLPYPSEATWRERIAQTLTAAAQDLLLVAERRRPGTGPQLSKASSTNSEAPVYLRQFVRVNGEMRQRSRPVPVAERPPARSVRDTAAPRDT